MSSARHAQGRLVTVSSTSGLHVLCGELCPVKVLGQAAVCDVHGLTYQGSLVRVLAVAGSHLQRCCGPVRFVNLMAAAIPIRACFCRTWLFGCCAAKRRPDAQNGVYDRPATSLRWFLWLNAEHAVSQQIRTAPLRRGASGNPAI